MGLNERAIARALAAEQQHIRDQDRPARIRAARLRRFENGREERALRVHANWLGSIGVSPETVDITGCTFVPGVGGSNIKIGKGFCYSPNPDVTRIDFVMEKHPYRGLVPFHDVEPEYITEASERMVTYMILPDESLRLASTEVEIGYALRAYALYQRIHEIE